MSSFVGDLVNFDPREVRRFVAALLAGFASENKVLRKAKNRLFVGRADRHRMYRGRKKMTLSQNLREEEAEEISNVRWL